MSIPLAVKIITVIAIAIIPINVNSRCALAHVLSERFLVPPNAHTKSIIRLTIGMHKIIHLPIQPQVETCSSS